MNSTVLKENLKRDEYQKDKDKDIKNKPKVKYSVSCLFPNSEVRDLVMDIAKRY